MNAIVINTFCKSLDEISTSKIPTPEPKDDEVCIKVVASGVNFVDILYAQGKHQNNKSLVRPPFILGLEFAGIIVSAPSASHFKVGDAVFGDCPGSYCEYLTLPHNSDSLRRIPSSWSFVDAAGLGATLPVSYAALVFRGGIKAGETVLVHSAAGGLGTMAVQVAIAMGCRVIGTAGSAEKCAHARDLGADECFDYSEDDWWKRVLDVTNGRGVDIIFDPVGLIDLSIKCLAHRGKLLVVGFAGRDGQMEKIAMNRVLLKQATIIGYRYGESLRRCPDERRRIWRELQPLLDTGKIRPTAFTCYTGLQSVPRALKDLSCRKISGKAVVQVSEVARELAKPRL
ncbi:hypothetical protein FZEAL_6298 [Fusarium zealandicum]|uniref:Enoyl reductase (ER) domain-containing protein n=1 Tax=Fusarium zealandicum TaxID=1053134 RepID=A0A8H4UIW0_9HYPO|nr:hypothetical protein FZEAL_6298 [Fusarium zealandicum]